MPAWEDGYGRKVDKEIPNLVGLLKGEAGRAVHVHCQARRARLALLLLLLSLLSLSFGRGAVVGFFGTNEDDEESRSSRWVRRLVWWWWAFGTNDDQEREAWVTTARGGAR